MKENAKQLISEKDSQNVANKEWYKILPDISDSIDSKCIVDDIYQIGFRPNISAKHILTEISRLYCRCFEFNQPLISINSPNHPSANIVSTIKYCVTTISEYKDKTSKDIIQVLVNSLKQLLDENKIDINSKPAIRLILFVEYFVYRFT